MTTGPDNACKHASAACRQEPNFVGRKKGGKQKKKTKRKGKKWKYEKKEERGRDLFGISIWFDNYF